MTALPRAAAALAVSPGSPSRAAMTDSALQTLFDAPGAPAPGEDARAEVHDAVRALARALRNRMLYEGSANPAVDRVMDAARESFGALWKRVGHATLVVEERDLLFEGASVYQAEERESLSFLLYRDGIREITFHRGFEREELDVLLGVLAQVHRMRGEEQDDLLTLLWDHDWYYFRYRYVEALPEGTELPEGSAGGPPRAVTPARQEAQLAQALSPEDFRGALYFLDESELRRLDDELRREMARDLWTGVLNALFDRLEDGGALRQEQIVGILSDVLPTLLGAGKLELGGRVLAELVEIATSGRRLPAAVMRALRGLFDQLSSPDTIAELVRTVEQAGSAVSEESLASLLSFFPPDALRPLLRASETSASPAVRRSVVSAAERLADAHRDLVTRLVADPDPAVAGGAARLLGRLRVTTAATEIARLLRRAEASLRVVAIETLAELRSPTASEAVEAALDDAEREVRIAAAKALAALRYTPARAKLEAAIDSKRLREADLTERIAFFEAYGGLVGAEAVPLLDRVLNGKSWLGRRDVPEMRACAALALGRVRHPAAERALGAAAADPDPVVRSAVGRALKAVRG